MKAEFLRFIERASHLRALFRTLPLRDAIRFSINDLTGRREEIETLVNGTKVVLRTSTPDFEVAQSCLLFGEYAHLKCTMPQVILDAGANIGASSIYFAKRFPDAKIYAIEMEDENYALLCRNVRQYRNIVPVKAAIAAKAEVRQIYDRLTGPWGYTISRTQNPRCLTGQTVSTITIDELLEAEGVSEIDILKMDIEGGEKEVFQEAGNWVRHTNIIVVELHDRICMGCDRAFYFATKDYDRFERHGEKMTAYRQPVSE